MCVPGAARFHLTAPIVDSPAPPADDGVSVYWDYSSVVYYWPLCHLQACQWSSGLNIKSEFCLFFVLFQGFFGTVHVYYLSREVEGRRWAWCVRPRPVAAELCVNGSRSSRAFL